MKDTNEVFKSLRDYQKPIFNEILRHDKVLLKAPMDFGKTYLSCVYVSKLMHEGKIKTATFAIQNYEMRSKIISDLKAVGMDDAVIVCPEGKDKAFRPHKKKRVTSLKINPNEIRGKVIDAKYVENNWSSYNPYYVLLNLQRFADIIIVHHSMLGTNKKIRKTDLLIVDDADLMNRDRVFIVARYKVFQSHLQAVEDSTVAKEIREKISRYRDKLPLLNEMMDTLYSYRYIPENPGEIETTLVVKEEERRIEDSPYFDILMKNKTWEEVAKSIETRKRQKPGYGIKQASNPVKLNSRLEDFKTELRIINDGLEEQISDEISYAVSLHLHDWLEGFFKALQDPQFNVKLSKIDENWSTIEINMTKSSNFMDVVNQYRKVLWISATADPQELEGFSLIESKFDPNSDHKNITVISKEMIPEVLSKLTNHNVFVITNSKKGAKGAEEFRSQHGGEILTPETYKSIVRNAENSGGNLTIGIVNGTGSRGLDALAQLYDAVIVYSWIYRSVVQKDGEFYNEQFISQNLKDVSQFIGRIMRGSSEHILILIGDDSKIGSKLKQHITNENPDWKHIDNLEEVTSKIPERRRAEDGKYVLIKRVQRLKNGRFRISYEIDSDDPDRFPDHLEI